MTPFHDKRLKPLFVLHNRLRAMAIYHDERDALVKKIHAEQKRLIHEGLSGQQINNLIHDRKAQFNT
jgi:hypothetical protein